MLRALAVCFAFAAIACAIALGPRGTGIPLRDFEAYYAAGATWDRGEDPYGRAIWTAERAVPGVVATRDELLPFVGPPWTLPIFGLFARLPYETARAVWWTVLALSALVLTFGSLWLAIGARRPLDAGAAAALALAFGPVQAAFALGQLTLVSCACVVAVLVLLKSAPAGAAFAAFGAFLQPTAAVPLLSIVREGRARFALAAALAAGVAAAVWAGGANALQRYPDVLRAHAEAERCAAMQMTVHAVACGLGISAAFANAIAVCAAILAVAVCTYALISRHYDWLARAGIACAATPLLLPFAHEHTLAIALLPALLCVRRAIRGWWFAAVVAVSLIAVNWLGLVQSPGAMPQAALFSLATVLALIGLTPRRLRAGNASPLFVPAIAVGVAALAAQHQIGLWPDALPLAFHSAPALGTAQTWHAELSSVHLIGVNVTAAWLRAVSLAGCAMLTGVALAALRRQRGIVPYSVAPLPSMRGSAARV